MHQGAVRQIALALGALLGQNVTFEGVLALDFAAARKLETLTCSGLGFHFGHGARVLCSWSGEEVILLLSSWAPSSCTSAFLRVLAGFQLFRVPRALGPISTRGFLLGLCRRSSDL